MELLDSLEVDEYGSCRGASTCLKSGVEAADKGRFDEAGPLFARACKDGEVDGCRYLGDIYALGALAEPEIDKTVALYRWGCEEMSDAPSCHALGELYRVGAATDGEKERGAEYFGVACELGLVAGCHDEAVTWIEGRPVDEEQEFRAAQIFEDACGQGLATGCVNHAYMMAAGRGVGREHGVARELFEQACQGAARDEVGHRLSGLAREVQRDVYAVTEYRAEVACEQLEVLVVGGFEERIIAAFDAEKDELRRCYDDARTRGKLQVGRMTLAADVSADGDGMSPRIVDDELGLVDVTACVDEVLQRHLQDRRQGSGEYAVRWTISFVHPPIEEGAAEGEGGCDVDEVRGALGDAYPDLKSCGAQHTSRHGDDPGALVMRWSFGSGGSVEEMAMTTTVADAGLGACLREIIGDLEISSFDGGSCPVQVPLSFSDGRQLHFSVVGR